MDFLTIAKTRQSCRNYDETRMVEAEKLNAVLEAGRLAPSACNGQPYHITVCKGEAAKKVEEKIHTENPYCYAVIRPEHPFC